MLYVTEMPEGYVNVESISTEQFFALVERNLNDGIKLFVNHETAIFLEDLAVSLKKWEYFPAYNKPFPSLPSGYQEKDEKSGFWIDNSIVYHFSGRFFMPTFRFSTKKIQFPREGYIDPFPFSE